MSTAEYAAMRDFRFVRDLSLEELTFAKNGRTGDRLPDGALLLNRSDMDRMGLRGLREWIAQRIVSERSTIALGSARTLRPALFDEII